MRTTLSARFLACLLAVLLLAGCSTWRGTPLPEAAPGSKANPPMLKLRTPAGEKVALRAWRVDGDSLRGTREVWGRLTAHQSPVAFALGDVRLEQFGVAGENARAMLLSPMIGRRVRILFGDGSWMTLESPRADGDSLRGLARAPGGGLRAVAFARSDVRMLEARKFSGGKTAILFVSIVGLAAVGLVVAWAIAFGNMSD
jgi:hypothetical protein